jgi:uncharacterized membrane protein YdjX (TVP38/TMEM64 family)
MSARVPPLAAKLWRPALMLAGLIAIGVLLREMRDDGVIDLLASDRGWHGMLGFVLLGAALSAAGLPRQAVAYAGGYAFGLCGGAALALAAQLLGCALDLAWARLVAREWARGWLRRRGGRFARRLDGFLARHPFAATVMLRLLPVGNNLALNLLAGVSSVAAAPFLAGSAVGYLPQTIVFALVGTGVRLDQSGTIGVGIALFAASAALGAMLLRRFQADSPAPVAGVSADAADVRYGATPPG